MVASATFALYLPKVDSTAHAQNVATSDGTPKSSRALASHYV